MTQPASPTPVRIFHVQPGLPAQELQALPTAPPPAGFYWLACTRSYFADQLPQIQTTLQNLTGQQLVDLHVSDLLNEQLPSHYDYTSQYDLMVFRRLSPASRDAAPADNSEGAAPNSPLLKRTMALRRIRTNPVGFAVFDQVLLSVHPSDCSVRDAYAARLLAVSAPPSAAAPAPEVPAETTLRDQRAGPVRLPTSTAELMLRIVNLIVDNYLDLRRELTRHLDHWQIELLKPRTRINDWGALLESRLSLHQLDEICEDQRAAMQDWIDAIEGWSTANTTLSERDLELLKIRSRDVLEHIERIIHHVRRLEQSAETAVQMHFSVQSNRTNDIMRTLTALTAVFLPLNLIAGIFGMNFEFIPFVHKQNGFWWAIGTMVLISTVLIGLFWRKRYISRTGQ